MSVQLLPYTNKYDDAIHALENGIVYGKGIRLKMLKNHFLGRSQPFQLVYPVLAMTEDEKIIGTSIGAATKLVVNDCPYDAGFMYDVKVHPAYRKKGVGGSIAKYIYQHFFRKQGFEKNFTTLKLTNTPVYKISARVASRFWRYPFVYMTIPTNVRVSESFQQKMEPLFGVTLFDRGDVPPAFFTTLPCGLSFFHTYRMYRLQIEKISFVYRNALRLMKRLQPSKYAALPAEKEIMEFVTLFDHTEHNIGQINEVLDHLQGMDKKFLLVCCRKGDSIYQYLNKYSINTYGYCMATDFPLSGSDGVTMDVRCL
jgi:GNAT superfamily N-acetyltransferase